MFQISGIINFDSIKVQHAPLQCIEKHIKHRFNPVFIKMYYNQLLKLLILKNEISFFGASNL